jgi:elongation factor 2
VELADRIENGKGVGSKDDLKERAKILSEEYDWEKGDALKIWSYGPENTGPNILVDVTKGVQFMNEIKDSMESAF